MTTWQDYLDTHLPAATTGEERRAAIQGALDLVPPHGYTRLAWPRLTLPYPETAPHGEWHLAADAEGVCLRIRDGRQVDFDLGGCGLVGPTGAIVLLVERDGDWSIIHDGSIGGPSILEKTGTCLQIEGPSCKLERLMLYYGECGLYLHGEGGTTYNADSIRSWALDIFDCTTGFRIQGADSNGGCFVGHVVFGGDVGILDESFLGNCHVGHQLHTTRLEAIKLATSTANYSTYVGTYMEADCGYELPGYPTSHVPIASVAANTLWLGGGVIRDVPIGDRVGLGFSRIRFGEELSDGGAVHVTIPHASDTSPLTIARMAGEPVAPTDPPKDSIHQQWTLKWRDNAWARDLVWAPYRPPNPNVPGDVGVPNDGLHAALGWTATGHPRGMGHLIGGITPARVKGRLLVPEEDP